MKINKLRIENFKSFYEPFELDFNDIKGFWKLSGVVGTGKTTIGEAILFGLYGSITGKNLKNLISWGRKKAEVELWCESKGHSIHIVRGISQHGTAPATIEVDGAELISTNKRDAQSQLETDFYDISRMSVELLCVVSFNNFKSLSTMGAADTRKFLDQVLGFYILTDYINKCKELRSDNQLNINRVTNDISRIKSQIDKIHELTNIQKIEGNQEEVRTQLSELNASLTTLTSEYTNKADVIQKKILKKNSELATVKTLGTNKANEIAFIQKGVCPTCGAPIDQSQLETKKKEREVFLTQYRTIDAEIKSIRESLVPIQTKYNTDRSDIQKKITECNGLLVRLQEQARRLAVNTEEINNLEKKISDLDKSLVQYESEDQQWTRLYNILANDVKSSIINSFIPLLNKNILYYTQRLHQPYIITYDNTFNCNIVKCGINQEIALSSLSAGQSKLVNCCIIFGMLGTIIGSNRLNVLVADELFSNMHTELCNELCEVLKGSMRAGDTMFIINHVAIDNRYFDGTIKLTLEQENGFELHTKYSIHKNSGEDTE